MLRRFKPRFCMAPVDGDAIGGSATTNTSTGETTATTTGTSATATTGTTAGDAATTSHEGSSASATVAAGVGTEAAKGDTADFRAGWDDTLKNDPSLKDLKTSADVAKALVETKKLVGQKLGIPGPDATPEAKAAFFEALGVPKEPAGYDFKVPDNIPEAMKSSYDQEHADKWAARFKELGIPKEAANALRNDLFAEMSGEIDEMKAAAETSDAEFNKLALSVYGDQAKATAALTNARTVIERHLPDALKGALNQLSNTALLAVATAIKGETEALTGEDRSISRDDGVAGDGKTVDQLRQEARELQALPEFNSAFTAKGKIAHQEVGQKVKDIYARINKMGGK